MSKIVSGMLISALTVIVLGPVVFPILRRLKLIQNVRQDGPGAHLKKSGTVTMGGILLIAALAGTSVFVNSFWGNPSGTASVEDSWGIYIMALLTTLGFGLIGLLDDSIKIIKKRSLGLRAYQKLIGQSVFALILACYAWLNTGSRLYIPFSHNTIDLGAFYIPLITLIVIFTANSVNLTDGLDGLVSTVTLNVCIFFSFVCYKLGLVELSVFSAAMGGACLGFLRYNSHVAQVFMGDTGSLALGGAVSALAVLTGLSLYLPIIGIIYMLEGLSVMLQVGFYKLTGRRVFKMAPLHHHFEMSGWHENNVVTTFAIVTTISCLIGFLSLL